MIVFGYTVAIVWVLICGVFFFYAMQEIVLMFYAIFGKKRNHTAELVDFPLVTIQLPLYNEKFVAERLLRTVLSMEYPKGKLEIQILDDSTDETSQVIREALKSMIDCPHEVSHIQRPVREGFKAGALDYGMKVAKGEVIGIFDADFLPEKDFLMRTVPFLMEADNVGVVQSRWGHINEDFSFVTRAQSMMLNTHFTVEQLGRISIDSYINFNGTAGIWKKTCIEDAGGWQADTLTEDLDLSYRAQIKGWKFVYLYDVVSPAELPVTLDAYRTQQFRWSKGAAECVRKNLRKLWAADAVSLREKIFGTAHLFNSSVYLLSAILLIWAPLVSFAYQKNVVPDFFSLPIGFLSIFILVSVPVFFFVGDVMGARNKWKRILQFPINFMGFMVIKMAILPYMVVGIMEGYTGKKSAFLRTPKYNLTSKQDEVKDLGYAKKENEKVLLMEVFFGLLGAIILFFGFYYSNVFFIFNGLFISIGITIKIFFSKTVFRL